MPTGKNRVGWSTTALVALLVIASVVALIYLPSRTMARQSRLTNAETAANELASLLKKKATAGPELSTDATPESLTDGEGWRCCGCDLDDVDLKVSGRSPRYDGTTITVNSSRLPAPVVLTVHDAAAGKWDIHRPEVPA